MIRFNRRNFMISSAMLASLGARRALSRGPAPRRNTLTFGFRSAEMRMATVSEATTFFVTAPFEAPAEAVRIGFGNITGRPLKIDGVCCCEGSGWQPIAGSKWAYLKFRDPQSDVATDPAREPQACIVPPNSAANVPSILWSDWMSYQTVTRPRPQMLFRVLVPPQELPLNYWVSPGNVGRWIPETPVRQIEIKPINGDYVSDPGAMLEPSRQQLVLPLREMSPVYVVQYRTPVPGIQMVAGGDSILSQYWTFVFLATLELSGPALPISFWDTAWSARPSRIFLPILNQAIEAARPSITVMQGWAAADGMRAAKDQAYLQRIMRTTEIIESQGGSQILLKGTPRQLYGTEELASWQHVNQDLQRLFPNAAVFDPLPWLQDPERPGNWRPEMTNDGFHPNLAANLALRIPFEALLRQLLQ